MGPEIFSLISGFPFLPGPLERSSTVPMSYHKLVSNRGQVGDSQVANSRANVQCVKKNHGNSAFLSNRYYVAELKVYHYYLISHDTKKAVTVYH